MYEMNKSANVDMTFYYDTDTDPTVRTPAAEYGISPPPLTGPHYVYLPALLSQYPVEGSVFTWDLTDVAAGTYYLCADLDDGYNTTTWYSETPVIITAP